MNYLRKILQLSFIRYDLYNNKEKEKKFFFIFYLLFIDH